VSQTLEERKIISYHKQIRAGVVTTQIVMQRTDPKPDAEQLSFFTKETWEAEIRNVMRKFNTFYPSEISLLCKVLPPADSMVGPFYHRLLRAGKLKRTGQYRKSLRSTRRGSFEFEYLNTGV